MIRAEYLRARWKSEGISDGLADMLPHVGARESTLRKRIVSACDADLHPAGGPRTLRTHSLVTVAEAVEVQPW